jgi:hypothetical protein
MGRLDQQFTETERAYLSYENPSGWGIRDHKILAIEISQKIREVVRERLMKERVYTITDAVVDQELDSNPRFRRLFDLYDTTHAIYMCGVAAADAVTMEEVRQIQKELESKKQIAVRLLKTRV